MGGPGSGRIVESIREKRLRTINKCWNTVDKNSDKVDVALPIAVKDMVNKSEVDMQANITQQETNVLTKYIPVNRLDSIPTTN